MRTLASCGREVVGVGMKGFHDLICQLKHKSAAERLDILEEVNTHIPLSDVFQVNSLKE
jgi:hypothetical protein